MFSRQVNELDALLSAGADPVLVDTLRSLLGQCQASLEHRGPVAIVGARPEGATDAMLTVSNGRISPESEYNPTSSNGYAITVESGITNLQGGLRGGIWWGKASGDWTPVSGNWNSYVSVNVVSDREGTAVYPAVSINVYLPRTSVADPNVRTNDVICFMVDRGGTAICISDVLDGKIGEERTLVDASPTDITAYGSGVRGWFLMDGLNGTVDSEGLVSIGDPASSAGPPGTVVPASASISISGTAGAPGNIAVTIANAVTGITIDDHTLTLDTIFSQNAAGETSGPAIETINGSQASVTLTHTVTEPNGGTGHTHSGSTVASTSIAATLSADTSNVQPNGYTVIKIMRMN